MTERVETFLLNCDEDTPCALQQKERNLCQKVSVSQAGS